MKHQILTRSRRWLAAAVLQFLVVFNVLAVTPPLAIGEVRVISSGESMKPANSMYQKQVTGMPPGQSAAVGVDKSISRPGYVKFDGVNNAKRELTEVKGFGYKVDKNGDWSKSYVSRRMQEKVKQQANRQLTAAQGAGMKVKWVVPSEAMKKAFGNIIGSKIPIDVVPPSQEVEDLLKKISNASGSF
ncbi:MAG TPA: Tox-REase-5 domain-containing protein [Terriglobales bacterium]|nr:Tox-REase-5 domain-containing protein [Terriglobales bacterium]